MAKPTKPTGIKASIILNNFYLISLIIFKQWTETLILLLTPIQVLIFVVALDRFFIIFYYSTNVDWS